MNDRNAFGGLNPRSLYVPMSETEQEFLDLMIASGGMRVVIHGWGEVETPRIVRGDLQLVVPIAITFDRPETPIPVSEFDLELRYGEGEGICLFRETQSTLVGGAPLMVESGFHLSMVWHIGIRAIDPALIRAFLPGARGLTSRNLDRDTGEVTVLGNWNLDTERKRLLEAVRRAEAGVRASSRRT